MANAALCSVPQAACSNIREQPSTLIPRHIARSFTTPSEHRGRTVSELSTESCPARVPAALEGKPPAVCTHQMVYKAMMFVKVYKPVTPFRFRMEASLRATLTWRKVSPAPTACGQVDAPAAVKKEPDTRPVYPCVPLWARKRNYGQACP